MKTTAACVLVFLVASVAAKSEPQVAPDKQVDKPMEETKKNIKVLRGVPSSQLIPIMTVMANSLGVSCAHCHEEAWESDAKPAKETARKMIRMTRGINEASFEGRTAVGCNTCHRGSTRPVSMPLVADAGWAKPRHATVKIEHALPVADDILKKYLNSWGKPEALAAVKRRVSSGVATVESGRTDPTSSTFVMTQTLPGPAQIDVEAKYPPEASRELGNQFFNQLAIRDRYASMKTIGATMIRGREAYIVESAPKEGGRPERLYFDATNGWILRRERERFTIVGPLPEQYDFDDYRVVDGVTVPFLLQWSRGDYRVTHRIAEVKQSKE